MSINPFSGGGGSGRGAPPDYKPRVPTPSGNGAGYPQKRIPPNLITPYIPDRITPVESYTSTPTPTPTPTSTPKVKSYAGSTGSAVDPNKATNDLLDSLYGTLTGQVTQTGNDNKALYEAALKAIGGNYEKSNSDLYSQYSGSRDGLAAAASNLGVDFNASSLGQGYDKELRRIQEMSDSNLNSDQSYLEKMKILDQNGISSLLTGIQQELVDRKSMEAANALAARLGRGSSRGRGGGGGSSKSSGASTEKQTINNVGDMDLYNELLATNPNAAAAFLQAYNTSEFNPAKTSSQVDKDKGQYVSAATMASPFLNLFRTAPKAAASSKKIMTGAKNNANTIYTPAKQAALALSGVLGNPKIVQTITNKGK